MESAPAERHRFVVVGGGISGLAAAHRLGELASELRLPIDVLLVEASNRLGGSISTRSYGDFIIESGADSFITQKPWALDLCRRVGLADRIIETNDCNRRTFVAFRGRLHPLPDGFIMLAPTKWRSFLKSSLFSWFGKLRMAMDLLLPRRKEMADESLSSFVRRRFGQEALERVAQPMIGGVYTADPEKLSMLATFPRFLEMEQSSGSVIRGLVEVDASRRQQDAQLQGDSGASERTHAESGARYSMFVSLDEGMQVLVDSLAGKIPRDSLRLGVAVSNVVPSEATGGWEIALASGASLTATGLILATPASVTARLTADFDEALASDLASIPLASSAVLNLIYARKDIPHQLDGFGFVVPAIEKRSIIACSFTNVKFSGRAPEGKVILRVFMGGALQPDVYGLTDHDMEAAARADLECYLGVKAAPLSVSLTRHPNSMPQFQVGHLALVSRIESRIRTHPGLALAGNAYRGVGIPDCIHSGESAAEALLAAFH